jgi:exosortase E/protease (VPEID-CTERM system)
VALLLGEGLVLGIGFDSGDLARLPAGWWTLVLRPAGLAMPVVAAASAALALIAWSRLRRTTFDEALRAGIAGHRYRGYLVAHLCAFGALLAVSTRLFAGGPPDPGGSSSVGLLVAAWLASALAAAISWLAAVAPLRSLVAFARAHLAVLGAAALLGLGAYGVGRLAQNLWLPLRQATFALASGLLGVFGRVPVLDPSAFVFGTEEFEIEISAECSGYEGVGLTAVFLLAAMWLFRAELRFPRTLLLLPAGALLSYLANAGRLVALVLVGTHVSGDIAAGGFHSYVGTLLFCTVALGTVAFALRSPWFARVAFARAATSEPGASALAGASHANPAAPYLVPFLALVAAGLVSRAFSTPTSEPLYALRPVAAAAALVIYRREYRRDYLGLVSRPSWFAVPAGLAMAALWLAIDWLVPGRALPAVETAAPAWGAVALRVTAIVLVVPVVEELAFRGFLARRISGAAFDLIPPARISWTGIIVSSLAFGLLHRRPLAAFAAGLCYAFCYRWRGRIMDAVVAHAVTNAALVPIAWLTDRWHLWM